MALMANDAGRKLALSEACNILFMKRDINKQNSKHPKSKKLYCIDFAIMWQWDRSKCVNVTVMTGAECQTDHQLLSIKKTNKKTGKKEARLMFVNYVTKGMVQRCHTRIALVPVSTDLGARWTLVLGASLSMLASVPGLLRTCLRCILILWGRETFEIDFKCFPQHPGQVLLKTAMKSALKKSGY